MGLSKIFDAVGRRRRGDSRGQQRLNSRIKPKEEG